MEKTRKPVRDDETEGRRERTRKTWVREEEKKSESINHSYAPVRVASGTNGNHMQLDNIPKPLARWAGSQRKTLPLCSPASP